MVDRYYCVNDLVKKITKNSIKENKKLKIVSVGWPRFDLMKESFKDIFRDKVKQLKNIQILLFNSDFALVSKKDIKEL